MIINSFLFYDCFNSSFAFDSYYNYTCRSSDLSFVGCNYCVSDSLTKYVSDYHVLAGSALNDYCTVGSYNLDRRVCNTFVGSCFFVGCLEIEYTGLTDSFANIAGSSFMAAC